MTTTEALRAGLNRIRTIGWRQGSYSVALPYGPRCADESLITVGDAQAGYKARRLLWEAAGIPRFTLPAWNDDPSRTVEDVITVYERAIALAEAEEGKP